MRSAKPSTTAVLPTPASPVRIGLFCRRRMRMSTIWRISSSRPTIGSISPLRACSVRSTENCFSASCLPIAAGAHRAAGLAGRRAAARRWSRPGAASALFGRAGDDVVRSRRRASSTLIFSNSREIEQRVAQARASSGCRRAGGPVRTCDSPNSSVAVDPAALDRLSMCGEKSEIEVAPAGQPVERRGHVRAPGAPGRARSAGRCGAGPSPAAAGSGEASAPARRRGCRAACRTRWRSRSPCSPAAFSLPNSATRLISAMVDHLFV